MHSSPFYSCYSDSIVLPKLIHIENNLYVASFYVMKLLPAKYMLDQAYQKGELTERSVVAETSSGSFALGIGIVCREMNLPFHIVSDCFLDLYLKKQLESLGGVVHIAEKPAIKGGFQKARLDVLNNILDNTPNSYWPCQYDNPDNAKAYERFGKMICDTFPQKKLVLVGPVGSGGSTCGTMQFIREINQDAKLIGVDTVNSILFGLKDGPRHLIGLGNSIMPKNLNHSLFDEVHWVSAEEAFCAARELHYKKGLFLGPTTGASLIAARWAAEKNKDHTVIFISPDEGHRYIHSVYDLEWLRSNELYQSTIPNHPIKTNAPSNELTKWSYMHWDRRSISQI